MKKIFIIILTMLVSLSSFSYAAAVEKDTYSARVNGVVELNKNGNWSTAISFDEMVEEIAFYTGASKAAVISSLIENEVSDLRENNRKNVALSRTTILQNMKSRTHIKIQIAPFPTFKNKYRPKGLVIYAEGEKIGQDHTYVSKIVNVVFDRNNAIQPYNLIKTFVGNVFVNLEASDRIYFSVDGDFYDTGDTTHTGSISLNIGEHGNISYSASNTSGYFAYIYHDGTWNG